MFPSRRSDERQIKAKIIAQLINPTRGRRRIETSGSHVNFELYNWVWYALHHKSHLALRLDPGASSCDKNVPLSSICGESGKGLFNYLFPLQSSGNSFFFTVDFNRLISWESRKVFRQPSSRRFLFVLLLLKVQVAPKKRSWRVGGGKTFPIHSDWVEENFPDKRIFHLIDFI